MPSNLLRKSLASLVLVLLGVFAADPALASPPVSGISSTEFNEGTDKAAVFYNPLVVSAVNLTLPQTSVDELNNNPGTSVYQHASVTITTADGVVTTLNNIGVRLKGQATRTNLYGKAPLKLKFDAFVPGQKFLGLTRMTLNSMVQDPSFIHEDTAYRLYRAMGIIAPRTTYSWVTLNGADFGLYMNIEAVDSQMLKRWITVKHLYSSNCYLADLTSYQSGCYDTNYGDADRTDLNAAIAVSAYDGANWWREVNKVADMTAVINLMATDIYTSNWDGYTDVVQNNYYIVFDDTGKLKIIPWGQDGAFPMDPAAQLDWLGRGPAFRNFGYQQRSVMLRKCVAYDPCQALLVKAQVAVKKKAEQLDLIGFKNRVAAIINQAYVSHETRANADVNSAMYWQNWLDTFFPSRTAALTAFLNTRSPEAPLVSLNGSATVGATLSADASTWDYTATLRYQWLRDGQPIMNGVGATYLLTPADQAHLISVAVSATKTGLPSATATSQAVLVSGYVAPQAVITGNAVVGGLLTALPGNDANTQVSYKWLRAGRPITGATSNTYVPVALDFQKQLSVTATITQTGYQKVTSTSNAVNIAAGTMNTPQLDVSGTPAMGNTLSVAVTNLDQGNKASYQWLRDSVAISGATRATYVIKPDDVYHSINVRATYTKVGYNTLSVTAAATDVFPGSLTRTPTPTIIGTATVNKLISANPGMWDSQVKLNYQWLRNGTPIANAIGKTYKLVLADRGNTITVSVTGVKSGYTSVTTSSSGIVVN